MTSQATSVNSVPGGDWRIWFGLGSTIFWVGLGLLYIESNLGWASFAKQPAEVVGSFLEGAFAPLAFLWLVIGFFLQQRELRQNSDAIRMQYNELRRAAESSEAQSRALEANALHQRQETFLMISDRVHRQLGAVTGLLWTSSQASGGDNVAPDELVNDLWGRLGSGDPEAFARQLLGIYYRGKTEGVDGYPLFYGTETRTRHARVFRRVFSRLLKSARECDDDNGMIVEALLGSPHGLLYRVLGEVREAGPGETQAG
ncbi:MAG: hypothetical protein HKP27_00480 [Myxococcales bacterium]|nr:hypothetical protein [Myxococcales bacterium]